MKTLYVSDLDGTLLNSDEITSDYTNQVINELVDKGMLFSYATARSYSTSHKVTQGLNAKIPLIVYNGTFVRDNQTGDILLANYFSDEVKEVIDDLLLHGIYPIVYSFIDGIERFSFVEDKCTEGMTRFINSRKGDSRHRVIAYEKQLYEGNIFYLTCIDDEDRLQPFYEKYKEQYHCIFQKDIYTHDQWLEILPQGISKAHAIKQLKEYLKCDKVIVFGDSDNDYEMFEMADEAYAVENAAQKIKDMATGIIKSNNEDGVAKWLKENYK